jgi:predicted transcriptional regulator
MSAQTTIRLSSHTRDELNRLAQERGLSADQAVATAIKALRDEEWRRRAEREALAMACDPADRAEVAKTLRYLGDSE